MIEDPKLADPTRAFTAFGKAVAGIAAFEQIMRLALGKLEVERAQRAGDAGADRFQRFSTKMLRYDFGQLSHRLRTQFKLADDPWLQIFKDAKDLRNDLAHDFWSPNYALIRDERGIDVIVRRCRVVDRHFQHLAELAIQITGVDVDLYLQVVSDPVAVAEAIKGFEERLVDAEKALAHLP
jgi:hypothetical protein